MSEVVARVLHGAAAAEAATWGAMFQRALLLPYWTRRKRREVEDAHDRAGSSEIPVPFALNQPTAALRAGPGPRTEWLVFQLRLLHELGGSYDLVRALRAWRALSDELSDEPSEPPRLSVSQRAALDHLQAGREPPISGHDQPHYFDDAACVRALAMAAVMHDRPQELLTAVRLDAAITNSEDGVWAAESVAVAVAAAAGGARPAAVVEAACARLPQGSWISQRARRALELAAAAEGPLDLALVLDRELSNAAYSYGDAAPDVLPMALAIFLSCDGDYRDSLLSALAVPRHAPALAPLVGALCAAGSSLPLSPDRLRGRLGRLLGIALPALRGVSLDDYAADPGASKG